MHAITPLTAAEGPAPAENSTARSDEGEQAWVDDCPPDMMCAADANETGAADDERIGEKENATRGPDGCELCRSDDGPTYDGDCGGEVCEYDAQPGTTFESGGESKVKNDARTIPAAGFFLTMLTLVGAAAIAGLRRS